MRILFTFIGGSGHFMPLIFVARAAMERGHAVRLLERLALEKQPLRFNNV